LQGKIKSLEQIYLFSLPIKEYQGACHGSVQPACPAAGGTCGAVLTRRVAAQWLTTSWALR